MARAMLVRRRTMLDSLKATLCALLAGTVGPAALYFRFLMAGVGAGGNLGSGYLEWVVGHAGG